MTTKPKAKKFRIRRGPDGAAPAPQPQSEGASTTPTGRSHTPAAAPAPQPAQARPNQAPKAQSPNPAQPTQAARQAIAQPAQRPGSPPPKPPTRAGAVETPRQVQGETTIDSIRKEGLTGRQLRMARRVAQKNGIAATSDFEAVKLLRERGIDPFERANSLEIAPRKPTEPAAQNSIQLPQTAEVSTQLPSTDLSPAAQHEFDIRQVQREIVDRRRRKIMLLATRLMIFLGIPTLIMGYYFSQIASPMYSTETAFLIQQNEASAGAGGGGLAAAFGGNQLATVQDSIAVQGYLTSREAMIRLDQDLGFKAHFQDDSLDAVTRLASDATNEDTYKIYKRKVKIGYDPAEGIVRMEVIAASPEASFGFSTALLGYAEQQISDLSQRLRNDQMRGARESFDEAELKRAEAAETLVALQTRLGTVDPQGVVASSQARISQFETELEEARINLDGVLGNRRPNQIQVDQLQREIRGLEASILRQKALLTEASESGASLAEVQARINIAQIDLQTRDAMLQQALQAMETARITADRQVRFVAVSTPPTQPDKASYPRVFENTVLSFLIFAGIYLMVSLTASILREQVSN